MTTIELNIKQSYIRFQKDINERINSFTSEIDINLSRVEYISAQLKFVGESHNLRNDLYKVVNDYYTKDIIPELDYLNEVNFKALESEEWFISTNPVISAYFKSFVNTLIYIYNLRYLKNLYELCNIDYQTYYRIISNYYNNVANSLLKGEEYIIHGVGKLKVISRRMKLSRTTKFKVDWGESLNVLKEFAKNHHYNIYELYINKKINKQSFIHALKPFCYDEKTNPTGFKWLVHLHKDYSAWIIFCNKKINSNYNIVPSNFIMNETRSQIDFTNNIKSIDEIYNSNRLGFRDKLNCLLRYDFNYINRFPTI